MEPIASTPYRHGTLGYFARLRSKADQEWREGVIAEASH